VGFDLLVGDDEHGVSPVDVCSEWRERERRKKASRCLGVLMGCLVGSLTPVRASSGKYD